MLYTVKSAPPAATSAKLVLSVLVLEDANALLFLLKFWMQIARIRYAVTKVE